MNYVSFGDMAQAFQLRRHDQQLKTAMTSLTREVMTGIRSDLGAAVSGDFTALAKIDQSRSTLAAYRTAAVEADLHAGTMQRAVETIRSLASGSSVPLLSAAATGTATMIDASVADAATKFSTLVATLNTNAAGRYAFSGAAIDTAPLPDPQAILSALSTELVGAADPADALARIADWFAQPTGFAATVYQGSASQTVFRLGEGDSLRLDVTATDPRLLSAMQGFATAALLDGGLFAGDLPARSTMTAAAGEQIAAADFALTDLAAEIGTIEARIAVTTTRNDAESAALDLARASLIGADPYESATALEAVRSQIETLYTLTSRLSALSMTEYMR